MGVFRALVVGVLMVIGSTAVYITSVVHSIAQAALPGMSPLDLENVIRASTIHSPAYWVMALIFLTSGFVIVLFRLRPTP
jgi:hypothetical protein